MPKTRESKNPIARFESTVTLAVQINGKLRGELNVAPDAPRDELERQALSLEAVARMLDGKAPKKIIIVPNRIVNVVV